jgi:hypothetical protein
MNAPFAIEVGGIPMIRISLSYVYTLATQLEPLEKLPEKDAPYSDVWLPIIMAQSALENLYRSIYGMHLRSSSIPANELNDHLKAQMADNDMNRVVNQFIFYQIKEAYRQFKIVLSADLSIANAYFVTQKGGFDISSLLASGENLFPPDLPAKVPEAVFDCREAGKCLAYELSTACGFHIFRAVEAILRKYYTQVSEGKAPPKVRNIGVYLNAMKIAGVGDEKIRFALKQLTDLYRNPLIHPEAVLTQEEAIGIFGLARSAIGGMLAVLPIVPPTTSTAVTAPDFAAFGALPEPAKDDQPKGSAS